MTADRRRLADAADSIARALTAAEFDRGETWKSPIARCPTRPRLTPGMSIDLKAQVRKGETRPAKPDVRRASSQIGTSL